MQLPHHAFRRKKLYSISKNYGNDGNAEEINQIGIQQLFYHGCTATYPYVFLTLHQPESFNQKTRIVMDECKALTAFCIPVCDYICIITLIYPLIRRKLKAHLMISIPAHDYVIESLCEFFPAACALISIFFAQPVCNKSVKDHCDIRLQLF